MKFLVPSPRRFILILAIVTALLVTGHSSNEVKEISDEKVIPVVEVEAEEEIEEPVVENYESNNTKDTATYNEPSYDSSPHYESPPPQPYYGGGAPNYPASANYENRPYPEPTPYSYPEPMRYSAPPFGYSEPMPYPIPPPSYPEPMRYPTPPPSYPEPMRYPTPTPSYPEPMRYPTPPPSYPEPMRYPTPPPSYPEPMKYSAPPISYSEPAPASYSEPVKYSSPSSSYAAPASVSYPEPVNYSAVTPTSYSEPTKYSAPASSPAPVYYQAARQYTAGPAQTNYTTTPAPAPAPQVKYTAPVAAPVHAPATSAAPAIKYSATGYKSSYPLVMLQYPQHLVPATPNYKQSANYTQHMPNYHMNDIDSPWGDNRLPESWWIYQVPIGGYRGNTNYHLPLHRDYQRNYRANHPTLSYYATAPYRQCPREVYRRPPTEKDIRVAFEYAQSKMATQNQASVSYLNISQPSYAARHQIFSSIATGNSRSDEQGLLVEYASEYIANRACLTKWDKQRYLPTLTLGTSVGMYPAGHSCQAYGGLKRSAEGWNLQQVAQSKYRTLDGFGNNPYHPYWGKANVCHIRLLSPDYADGISEPRVSYLPHAPLPNPRAISQYIHRDVHLEGPYNMLKMQWGQFINHDITNTQLSSYDGLVDCCKTPNVRGCYPIVVPPYDKFYSRYNVTCLNFVRSGVCPLCQFGPRQQINKNTAFLDASHVYGHDAESSRNLRLFKGGLLRYSVSRNGEIQLPLAQNKPGNDQCQHHGCYVAGDSRVNQHPALTALHLLLLRRHNQHAQGLAQVHPNYNDELLFQEARRIVIAEYQMITYNEYLPIVFGPILSEYYHLTPGKNADAYTQYNKNVDPTTWNEYSTAACRFGHSQIQNLFGLYPRILNYYEQRQQTNNTSTFRLKDWFMDPSLLNDGFTTPIINGLISRPSLAVDPWIANDVRNHLYKSKHERTGGDLPATNIQRGRDHGIPSYTHYLEFCFNHKVRNWQDMSLYIPWDVLEELKHLYVVPENVDLFTGGLSERHFPEADIGPTFACINGIQYYHLKFGDRYYFEHRGQAGSFTPVQLYEIKKSTMARLLCRTAYLTAAPQYAFFYPSQHNPLVDCARFGEINYRAF